MNKSKFIFNVTQITFFGHKLTEEGIYPDSSKVEAILKMPTHNIKSELQTFLGIVALAQFISHLSDSTAFTWKFN